MHWSIPLVGVPALILLLLASERVRRLIGVLARTACRTVNRICAGFSGLLDVVLRPDSFDGRIRVPRLLLWGLVNAAALAALYQLRASERAVEPLAGAMFLTNLHVLLLGASVLKTAEENRIMQLGRPRTGPLYSPRAAVRDFATIALEAALVVAMGAAALNFVSDRWPGLVLVSVPRTGLVFADYLLCVLAALPVVDSLVGMTEFAGKVVYGGPLGNLVRSTLQAMVWSLAVGAVTARLFQRVAMQAILARFEDAEGDDAHFLQLVVNNAPPGIKTGVLELALDRFTTRAQSRAINTMPHLKVWTFPQTFIHHCREFERSIQIRGLTKIREFLAADGMAFDLDLLVTGANKAFALYVALAPTVASKVEDAVFGRVGALLADYMTLIVGRGGRFKVSKHQYGALLDVAKAHKDSDVRRRMASALMVVGAKGFMMNFVTHLNDRVLTEVDVEIVRAFIAYVRANPKALTSEDVATMDKRVHWGIAHGTFGDDLMHALKELRRECGKQARAVRNQRSG